MYQLFRTHSFQQGGGKLFPEFQYAKRGLVHSLEQVLQYHRINPQFLNANHFLVKLLQSLNIDVRNATDVYNDKVSDIALNLAMSLKMTSALSRGKVFSPGVFYGDNVSEIIIASIDAFDTRLLDKEWERLCPIRVIYHPKTDLNMVVPNGKYTTEESGYAVIVINIPMLAGQWRKFRQFDQAREPDNPMSIMQFLTLYPLPNMLHSSIEGSLFNRAIAKFFNIEIPVIKNPNPFYLTDYSATIDKTLDHYLKLVEEKGWNFDTMISAFPCVSHEDFHQVMRTTDMAFSQQIQWAIAMARFPLIAFLVQMNYQTKNHANTWYLNQIRRWMRTFDWNRTLLTAMPREMYDDAMVVVERGILPYL